MKFDKKFDVDDIKMVRNVKDFAAKHNIKGVVKKYSKKLQSAAVITSLAIICTVSITAAKTSDVPSEGRMLAVVDVKPEASGFDTTVNKVSYEDMRQSFLQRMLMRRTKRLFRGSKLRSRKRSVRKLRQRPRQKRLDVQQKQAMRTSQL